MGSVVTFLVLVGLLAVDPPSTQVPHAAPCDLFGGAPSCPETPRFQVDFTPERRLQQPAASAVATLDRTKVRVIVSPLGPVPIDCEMVRRADGSIDPHIVKAPPAGVTHTMRIVEVPACPVR